MKSIYFCLNCIDVPDICLTCQLPPPKGRGILAQIYMKLINKDKTVAEIEEAIDEPAPLHDQQCSWEDGYYCGLYKVESIIDTLEVKEVVLEREIDNWICDNAITHEDCSVTDVISTAKHFFELGLKAYKGE